MIGGRLFGQIRPWASLAAGAAGVRPLPFLLWSALGSFLYSAALLWVWLAGLKVWINSPDVRWLMIVAVILGFFGVTGYLGVRHVRTAGEADEIEEPECAPE